MWREIQNCSSTKIEVMDNFKKRPPVSYSDKMTEFDAQLLLLPDEILILILSHLETISDAVSVSKTCHRLRVLASDCQLWYPFLQQVLDQPSQQDVATRLKTRPATLAAAGVTIPRCLELLFETQPNFLPVAPQPSQAASHPSRRLYLHVARRIGAKTSLELLFRLKRQVDVNIWHDMCMELNRDLDLTCEIRSANDRLLAASVNSLIRRAVSLEDPWSSLPEDNITLFCALQTLLPQKLILQKLMEVTTVDVYSLHGFSRSLTSIDLLLANRGQVPLAAASKAAQVCSVCGRNVHASSLCIAKDNINDIKKYVQLRVATLIDFWITNYRGLLEETNVLPDLQAALCLPCWLPNIPIKSLITKAKQMSHQSKLPPFTQSQDFCYIWDTAKCVKDTAIRLTRDDLEVYGCIPNIELQHAALWSEENRPYHLIMSRLPYLGRVDHKARCLTEHVVTHLRSLKLQSKTVKTSVANQKGSSQATCIHHCIQLCSELHKLKNFVSLRALLVAVRSCMADPATTVSWKMVSYQDCKTYQKLEQLIAPNGNYMRFVWEERDKRGSLHYLPPFLSKTEPPQSITVCHAPTQYQQSDIAGIPVQHLISSDARRAVFPLRPVENHLKAARAMIELKPLMPTK